MTTAPRVYTDTEIAYIRGLNCDTLSSEAKTRCLDIKKATLSQPPTATGNTLQKPVKSETENDDRHLSVPPVKLEAGSDDRHPLGSQSGTTLPKPPKPPIGSGAVAEHPMEGIGMAIGKLTPADRDTLVKMIREYLVSKGVDLAGFADKKDAIKDMKKETKTEIKEVKKEA